MNTIPLRWSASPWLLLASFALAGCQGMYLHNADREAVAETAKTSVDSVKIDAISKTEQDNLDRLLQQELRSIDDRAKLVATLSVINLAATDQSVADQYRNALTHMELWLHTSSMRALQEGTNCSITKKAAESAVRTARVSVTDLGVKDKDVPACAKDIPPTISPPPDLDNEFKKDLEDAYQRYVSNCQTSLTMCMESADTRLLDERIRERDARKVTAENDKKEVEKARKDYQDAVDANRERSESAAQTEQRIRDAAKKLAEALGKLAKSSPVAANQVKGAAIVDLLNAAATGKSDSKDASLAPAIEVAKSLPGLAQSIAVAQANAAMVPTSHLVLALNNLTIQAERDARLAAIDAEEIAILERKVASLDQQARLWRKYSDELCNLVYLTARNEYPNTACNTIVLDKKVQCTIRLIATPARPDLTVPDCILARSWRDLFADKQLNARQRRALYEAAAAYLQVRMVTYQGVADDFRRVDASSRRAVVERETALAQWKNVVSVPTDTLGGYYKGGIKPAELADLIVKALGFTAITIGVAR